VGVVTIILRLSDSKGNIRKFTTLKKNLTGDDSHWSAKGTGTLQASGHLTASSVLYIWCWERTARCRRRGLEHHWQGRLGKPSDYVIQSFVSL